MQPVLFVTAARFFGGAERSLVELLAALREPESGVSARLLLALPEEADARLSAAARAAGAELFPLPFPAIRRPRSPPAFLALALRLRRAQGALAALAKRERVGLLHANGDTAQLLAGPAARRAGRRPLPAVWHCRDLLAHGVFLRRRLTGSAAAVVAISRAVAEHLARCGVGPGKLRVITNGIDLAPFAALPQERARLRAEVRREFGFPAECPLLVAAGAFVRWKRHEDFLRLVARLRRDRPAVRGLLCGAAPGASAAERAYAAELAALAGDAAGGAGGEVRLAGWRDDLPRLLAAADLFVSTSRAEPFGRVLVEALAAGVPVLATASGGKGEIVADGLTGRLVPDEDPEALAAAAEELLADGERARRRGEAGRARAAEAFDVRRVAREVAALWEELLSSARGHAP